MIKLALHGLGPVFVFIAAGAAVSACQKSSTESAAPSTQSATQSASAPMSTAELIERGRYIVEIGSCNDCHTPGYSESGGKLPESEWLVGQPFQGTIAPNLRFIAQSMPEADFVHLLSMRTNNPVMPWQEVNGMTDSDKRAVHRYIKSLGPKGKPSAVDPKSFIEPPAGSAPATDNTSAPPEHARYLLTVGGCNYCHTPGYIESDGATLEADWLIGSQTGRRGPWGTTYPSNLRLSVQAMTEDAFVQMAKSRSAMPPMPWPALNFMTDSDRRALYRYIKSLGPKGLPAPANLGPNEEPQTPFTWDAPPPPPQHP
jgi:mono/diheme cytochrome c family protein